MGCDCKYSRTKYWDLQTYNVDTIRYIKKTSIGLTTLNETYISHPHSYMMFQIQKNQQSSLRVKLFNESIGLYKCLQNVLPSGSRLHILLSRALNHLENECIIGNKANLNK